MANMKTTTSVTADFFTFLLQNRVKFILLLLLNSLIWSFTLNQGYSLIDDGAYTFENALYQQDLSMFWVTPVCQNYHPLTMLSFKLNYWMSPESPEVTFHFFNVLIHCINTFLVFFIAALCLKNLNISFFIAAVFAIHPMHVESVAWIAERKDVLYVFFLLLSLIQMYKWLQRKKTSNYLLLILFMLASALSKPQAMILVFWIPLIYFFFTEFKWKELILLIIPAFIISLLTGFLALWAQSLAMKDPFALDYGLLKPLAMCRSIGFYLVKFFIPTSLSLFYPNRPTFFDSESIIFIGAALLFFILTILKLKRKNILLGALLFISAMLPIIQIVPFGPAAYADRYSYLAYVGLTIWLCGFFIETNLLNSQMIKSISIAFVLVMSLLCYWRVLDWSHPEGVVIDAEKKYPNGFTKIILANRCAARGQLDSAKTLMDYAIKHDSPRSIYYFNKAHFINQKNLDEGLTYCEIALKIDSHYPAAIAFKGLLNAYKGNLGASKMLLNQSILCGKEHFGGFADPYLILGGIYEQENKLDSAHYCYNKAFALNPCSIGAFEKFSENN